MDLLDIFLLHGSESWDGSCVWQFLELDVPGHWSLGWEVRETNIDKLLGVQGSVIVSGGGDWGWNNNTSGVDGLPDIASIDSSSNFLDEDWRKSLCPQGFMHTEEINLSHENLFSIDLHVYWNA